MDVPRPVSTTSDRFIDRLTVFIRSRGLAYRTEKTYCLWIKKFIRFRGYTHPDQMRPVDIEAFLTYLAVERSTSINTQRTALNALVFLFREFLKQDVGQLTFNQAKKPRKLPTVRSREEAHRHGGVYLPDALARKFPNAPYELAWQYLFPADKYSVDPRSGVAHVVGLHERGMVSPVDVV